MTLMRWDPFREVFSLRDAMDRLMEESFVRPSWWANGNTFGLPLDVQESDNNYIVKASLPGYKPEDVNITVTGDTLTIRAEHRGEEERKGENFLLRERRFGTVSRSITLPAPIQGDQVQANYHNGELILTLPKVEEVKPRQIQITAGDQVGGHPELSSQTVPTEQHVAA